MGSVLPLLATLPIQAFSALVAGLLAGLSQLGGVIIAWGFLSDGLIRPLIMLGTLAGVIAVSSPTTAGLALVVATLLFTFGTRRAAPADAPHGA